MNELRTQNSSSRAKRGDPSRHKGRPYGLPRRFRYAPPPRNDGFTLIELSIVLIIIGLIVGGVLVGQDLIEAAKIRKQISQVQQLNTAINTFRLKYNAFPGDIADAVAMGLGTNTSHHNGDGNKRIDDYCFFTNHNSLTGLSKESHNIALHLSSAGLLEGNYTGYAGEGHGTWWTRATASANFVAGAFNTTILIPSQFNAVSQCTQSSVNNLRPGGQGWLLTGLPDDGDFRHERIISTHIIYNIDQKIDDGLPHTGNVGLDSPPGDDIYAAAGSSVSVGTSYNFSGNGNAVFLYQY